MNGENQYKKDKSYNIKYFILSFLIFFTVFFIILFVVEKEVRSVKFEELKSNEKRVVEFENNFLGDQFDLILADLKYLHDAF